MSLFVDYRIVKLRQRVHVADEKRLARESRDNRAFRHFVPPGDSLSRNPK